MEAEEKILDALLPGVLASVGLRRKSRAKWSWRHKGHVLKECHLPPLINVFHFRLEEMPVRDSGGQNLIHRAYAHEVDVILFHRADGQ